MPLYSYRCSPCEHSFEIYRSIAQMQQHEPCERCGGPAHKVITLPMIAGDWQPYDCPITGRPVEGKRAHAENLKKHGCRVFEAGEREAFIRDKPKRDAAARDACIDRVVDSTARSMGIIG